MTKLLDAITSKLAGLVLMFAVSCSAAYVVGFTRADMQHAKAALQASNRVASERAQMALAVLSARAKSDTIRDTVRVRIPRVDTAWARVTDTLFRDTTLRNAREACLALSSACSEQARLFALERAASDSLRVRDSTRVEQLQVRADNALRDAASERDRTWRRRAEGFGVCAAGALTAEWLRRRE